MEEDERKKLISDCYNQLKPGGCMVFITISKKDKRYGKGVEVGHDTFKTRHGIGLFFYDIASVEEDFRDYGLTEVDEIREPMF